MRLGSPTAPSAAPYLARLQQVLSPAHREALAEAAEDYGMDAVELGDRYLVFFDTELHGGVVVAITANSLEAVGYAISCYADAFLTDYPFVPLGVLDLEDLRWCSVKAHTRYTVAEGQGVHQDDIRILSGDTCEPKLASWYRDYARSTVPPLWCARP